MNKVKVLLTATICLLLSVGPVFAHHAAEGIVDAEIYAMIDTMVADTPHADMTLDDIAVGMTEMTITTPTVKSLEVMIDDGILTYIWMLDGEVTVNLEYSRDTGVTMTVTQTVP